MKQTERQLPRKFLTGKSAGPLLLRNGSQKTGDGTGPVPDRINERGSAGESQFHFSPGSRDNGKSFGQILSLNDDILEGGRSLSLTPVENARLVLLPLAGALTYYIAGGGEGLLSAGQLQFLVLNKKGRLVIRNNSKEKPVHLLRLWISDNIRGTKSSLLSDYDINKFQNSLVKISPQRLDEEALPFSISIGKFSGGGETVYAPPGAEAGTFLYAPAGRFEAAGRRLRPGEGLTLFETPPFGVKALVRDSILLVIGQAFSFLPD